MSELAPGYKPVTIGHEGLSKDFEDSLLSSEFVGLRILSDSVDLHGQLSLTEAITPSTYRAIGTFRYVTGAPLPLLNAEGNPLRHPDRTHPGDIYAQPGLRDFYFHGNTKLGTLASMAYGIRALNLIQEDQLGLHSSLILDRESERTSLIIGRNRSGKSTIGQAIEDAGDRFLMIADDWSEFNLSDGTVTPISKLFSPSNPSDRYQLAFNSFGKSFYSKELPADLPPLVLDRVVELHDGNEGPEPDSFILRSLAHIPFLRQRVDESSFACRCPEHAIAAEAIAVRKNAILVGYHALTQNHETTIVRNDHSRDSLNEVVEKVREVLSE